MSVGFIILRHVNNEETDLYWQHNYDCIRKLYPDNAILIIDDNSNPSFLTTKELHNTNIINSEFPARGELLPYYYYIRNKLFDTAVIIHDSVFLQAPIDTSTSTYRSLWHFEHDWDQIIDETRMIKQFNDRDLYNFYVNKSLWKGCFGGMTVITHDYLTAVNAKYDLGELIRLVTRRYNRCSFERVIACLLQKESNTTSVYGNIITYMPWGVPFSKKGDYAHLPIVKVWTGR
jgi:hypothetical protein